MGSKSQTDHNESNQITTSSSSSKIAKMKSEILISLFCLLVIAFIAQPTNAQVCIVNSEECSPKEICISNLCTTYGCKTAADCTGMSHDEAYGLKVGCIGGVCGLERKVKRTEGLDDATMIRLIKRIVTSGRKR